MFGGDMEHLRDEMDGLAYQKESLSRGIKLMRKLSVGLLIFLAACVAVLSYLYMTQEINIVIPIILITVFATFAILASTAAGRRFRRDLSLNGMKRKKAVGMLNTKSAVFAHYTNYLNFSYNKYNVDSAEDLKKSLKDYGNYKSIAKRFDSLRSLQIETEADISALLKKHEISNVTTSLENFAKTFNIADKKKYYDELNEGKRSAEDDLMKLDKQQELIWDKLVIYDAADTEGSIKAMVQAYMQRVSGMVERIAGNNKYA
jgi:hypothetical protein